MVLKVGSCEIVEAFLFILFSVETKRDLALDVFRTLYSTPRADKDGCTVRDRAMASYRSNLLYVEEGKRVLNSLASRYSGLRKE